VTLRISLFRFEGITRCVDPTRCNNAGENRALESACIDKELGIVFEYTAPGTPQKMESWKEHLR